jgi:hypothetical protein
VTGDVLAAVFVVAPLASLREPLVLVVAQEEGAQRPGAQPPLHGKNEYGR